MGKGGGCSAVTMPLGDVPEGNEASETMKYIECIQTFRSPIATLLIFFFSFQLIQNPSYFTTNLYSIYKVLRNNILPKIYFYQYIKVCFNLIIFCQENTILQKDLQAT